MKRETVVDPNQRGPIFGQPLNQPLCNTVERGYSSNPRTAGSQAPGAAAFTPVSSFPLSGTVGIAATPTGPMPI
jgi:hypothetical protein